MNIQSAKKGMCAGYKPWNGATIALPGCLRCWYSHQSEDIVTHPLRIAWVFPDTIVEKQPRKTPGSGLGSGISVGVN